MKRCGFVLAGGESSRMGRDKATLVWHGLTFVERATRTLGSLSLPVHVLTGNLAPSLPGSLPDSAPGTGPLGALVTALEQGAKWNYLLACDMPLVSGDLFKSLERRVGAPDIILPVDSDGRRHPLAAIYSARCHKVAAERLAGGRLSLNGLLDQTDLEVMLVDPHEHGQPDSIFFNVNSPADLIWLSQTAYL